jgi:sigma-B regulation protein RsbU (phosphoserine phosphatase)
MWRFADAISHVLAVSKPVEYEGFRGRIWVFYNESQSSQARESLEYAHALLRASTDGMLDPQALLEAVRDPSGRITDFRYRDVNRAIWEYLGTTREELIGRTLLETTPSLGRSGLLARYAHFADSDEPLVLDDVRYDNEILSGPRRYDIRGNRVGGDFITLTWRDVTERVASAQRIAESEERFRLLAENSGDVVAHVRDGVVEWVSPSIDEVLGAPPEHWIGQDMQDTVPPDELANQAEIVGRITDGENVVARSRVLSVDGATHWIHLHGKVFRDAAGEPDGITVAFRIIDDEVRVLEEAEEARRQQARADARYRRLMDNSAVGMCMVTPEGRFDTVNPALCDFLGYDEEALKAKTWQELTARETLDRDLQSAEDMLAGRIDHHRHKKQYIHADGHLLWADLSVSCLRDAKGRVEYFVSQIIDITAEVESRHQVAQRDQQNRALTHRLQDQTDRLRSELKIAGAYVNSLLPGDLDGPVQVSHRYLPSRELGGDCFDYRWIDEDHLVIYLIDVSGHGIAPALESISVHNLLRSGSLPTGTLLEPAAVLAELNHKFPMDQHGGNYFTMWYGVYRKSTRTLCYASAGHPPALMLTDRGGDPVRLAGKGVPVGMFADTAFSCETYAVPRGAEILLYSDGAFEFPVPEGATWSLNDFVALWTALYASGDWTIDGLAAELMSRTVGGLFTDDCSFLRLRFR